MAAAAHTAAEAEAAYTSSTEGASALKRAIYVIATPHYGVHGVISRREL
jgi:hypothetical protein